MTVEHVELLVEEPSMEALVREVAPKLLGAVSFDVYPFRGKMNLLGELPNRLRGYAAWLPPTWRIVVVVDRDRDDCLDLKERLSEIARAAGLDSSRLVNRIAIEELEAWYFGDLEAVRTAYPRVPRTLERRSGFRDPDEISNTWETFERVLKRAGYFKGGLRKKEAARAVGKHMEPGRNQSRSFQAFRDTLIAMAG